MYKLMGSSEPEKDGLMVVDKRGRIIAGVNGVGELVLNIKDREAEFVTSSKWRLLQAGTTLDIYSTLYARKSKAKIIKLLQLEHMMRH